MSEDEYVTKADCAKNMAPINSDLLTIKKALVGDDLRGGLVQDVTYIKTTLKNNPNQNNGNSLGKRERAMVYCSLIASSGVVAVEVIKTVFH
jgi:hypothetical protein